MMTTNRIGGDMLTKEQRARALESLRDEMRKLTYSFDSRERMEQIFSIAIATQAAGGRVVPEDSLAQPYADPVVPSFTGISTEAPALGEDNECICNGNWREIVKKTEHLLDKRFRDNLGEEFTFFGIVHGSDDYYYGMRGKTMRLLSCVGSIEGHGFELIAAPPAPEGE